MMNGTTGSSFGLNYIDLGARLGGWGSVGFRHNLLLKGEARIPLTIQLLGSSDEPTFAINGNQETVKAVVGQSKTYFGCYFAVT